MHSLKTAFGLRLRGFVFTIGICFAALLLAQPQAWANGFQTGPPKYAVGLGPFYVTTADLRNIDREDIIVSNSAIGQHGFATSNTISVLLSNGDGTYQPAKSVTVGSNPIGIVAADFNGDGKIDLAVTNANSSNVSILIGNGDGTFKPGVNVAVGTNPTGIVAGKFTSSGHVDLVVTNSAAFSGGTSNVSFLKGNGNGTFQPAVNFSSGGPNPLFVSAADFNGDGKLDLAITNSNSFSDGSGNVAVLLGNGNGTFSAPHILTLGAGHQPFFVLATPMRIGSVNFDLVVSDDDFSGGNGDIAYFKGNGDGTFQPVAFFAAGLAEQGLAITDFNGDGKKDLATIGNKSNTLSIILGNGDGTFQSPTTILSSVNGAPAAVDANGDGKIDLAVLQNSGHSQQGAVELLFGNGNGGFSDTLATYSLGSNVEALSTGTFTASGNTDLAVGLTQFNNGPSSAFADVLLGNGDGTFAPQASMNITQGGNSGASGVATGIFNNGSGHQDIVLTQNSQIGHGFLTYIPGNGDGTFGAAVITSLNPHNPFQLISSDFDNSGNLDVLFGDCADLDTGVGNGSGGFSGFNTFSAGFFCVNGQLASGQFYGTGFPDAAVIDADANGGNLKVYVYKNNGSGGFNAPATYKIASATTWNSNNGNGSSIGIAAGHFNEGTAANHLDLAVTDPPDNKVIILTNNGDGTFSVSPTKYMAGGNPIYVSVGDFNGDGHLDLAVANCNNCNMSDGSGSNVTILYGNGDGTFQAPTAATTYDVGNGTGTLAVGDFNNDGAPDLAAGNSLDGSVVIVMNTGGTLDVLGSNNNPAPDGQNVTFTDTITPTLLTAGPTGTVTFMDGNTTLGSGAVSSGAATFSINTLAPGTHTITAVYSGDANYNRKTSNAVLQVVQPGSTTALSSNLNPSTTAQSVTLTATVTPVGGAGQPSGAVTFFDGATSIGSGILNGLSPDKATLNHTFATTGIHVLTAVYGGDVTFQGSTSPVFEQTVNGSGSTASTTTISNVQIAPPATPGEPANTVHVGQTVSMTVTVAGGVGPQAPTGTVQLLDNGVPLGTPQALNGAQQATFSGVGLGLGENNLTAEYFGDANNAASDSTGTLINHETKPR